MKKEKEARKILKKIYQELVAIRGELQAIRRSMKPNSTILIDGRKVSGSIKSKKGGPH